MKNILSIEWLKIKRYRTFWILGSLFVVLFPLWNYGIAVGALRPGGTNKQGINLLSDNYTFAEVWDNLGFWGSFFINFLAILVIILVSNEFTFRTLRQNVIDGQSKLKVFHAKVLLVLVMSVAATLFLFILGVIFGRVNSGSFNGLFSQWNKLWYFFILSLDYMGFAMMLAFLLRRSGLAIGIFFVYSMIVETMLRLFINFKASRPYANLLMLQSSDSLLPTPLTAIAKKAMEGMSDFSMTVYAGTALGWCVVYYFICRAILLRKDW